MKHEDGDLEVLVKLPDGFPYQDLLTIAEMLRRADLFVPGYVPPQVGLYHPNGFIYENYVAELRTILLPDRNIVSRIAQVAKGEHIDGERQLAAALLAFAQCLDIQIEPSIAFHELAPHQGNDAAHEELRWFRAADDSDPLLWIAAGMGRLARMPRSLRVPDVESVDLERPLRRWRRNYAVVLKIAELELTRMEAQERVLRLLSWMYEDFILAGPGIMLACVYFAPNSPPRAGLLKSLRSPQRTRAIHGAKNAAWDLTHLSDFMLRANTTSQGESRYIFATRDAGLRHVADLLLKSGGDEGQPGRLAEGLMRWWSAADAERIADAIFQCYRNARSPKWREAHKDKPKYVDDLISQGEASLVGWSGG